MSLHNLIKFIDPCRPTSPRLQRTDSVESGFTLIEMLIVAPIVLVTIGIFVGVIVVMTGDIMANRGALALAYNIQDALNRIDSDVKLSGGFLATNNFTPVSPQGFDDGVAKFNNADATNGPMLILNSYATVNNPTSLNRNLIYMPNLPYACNNTLQLDQNQPMMYNIVYFVKNSTLWRRVLMQSNYTTAGCNGVAPWQRPSCAPAYSAAFCKTQDIDLVDGVTKNDITINYYTKTDLTTPISNTDSTDPVVRQNALTNSASSVSVTITANYSVAGRSVTQTGTIRSTSPNNNLMFN